MHDHARTRTYDENRGPAIYYFCPDSDHIVGSVKVIYRHVELLNSAGHSAFVVHKTEGFRCSGFHSDVPVKSGPHLNIEPDDIIVMPAIWSRQLDQLAPGVRKVIFNQGAYLTFHDYAIDKDDTRTPYLHPDLHSVMTVSDDSKAYLQYVFPDLKIVKIRNAIDPGLFSFTENKEKQISFMTRKNVADVKQVINMLKFRNALSEYELVPIENRTELEVAGIMADSLIYLSFCYGEGWSLPSAEAMASGCLVIGNHGNGARDIFLAEHSFPVAQGDIVGFARAIEDVLDRYATNPGPLKKMAQDASTFIRSHYAPEHMQADLLAFWREVLG